MRKELNSYPGLRAVVQDLSQQGFTAQRGFPVEFSVRGSDWNQLIGPSQKLISRAQAVGPRRRPRQRLPARACPSSRSCPTAPAPPTSASAWTTSRPRSTRSSAACAIGKYSAGGRRFDVRLRLLAGQRSRPEDLAHLRVRAATGELVPLSALVTTEERPALQAITRRDRERAITVFANVAPGSSQDKALAKVEELAKGSPVGVRVVLGGASVAFRESMSSLLFALVLGIIVAYMILASQFNSFLHPVTVLTILPLSIAGAAFALWGTGRSLNIFSMIGLLLLMGIVKKNSIILVDYANQLREKGRSAAAAILRAGPVRLRPILMTSVATMMAAIPAALGLGAGSETRAPMAVAVIGGLIVSTALSLLVVPAFYLLAARAKERLRARRARRSRGFPAPSPSATATRP